MRRMETFSLAVMVAFFALLVPARGQEKEASQKTATGEQVRKVIQLKYADPGRVVDLLNLFGAGMRWDRQTKVLTVVGPASAVQAVEEATKKLDVPPAPTKDFDITAYFLLATEQPVQTPLPSELDEVVGQLRRVLKYQHFRLLNTALVRTRDGNGASVHGVASASSGESQKADFSFSFNRGDITSDGKVPTIRINGLDFVMTQPAEPKEGQALRVVPPRTNLAKIHTDIDVPEGQKVVVGKTTFDSPDNALVLVLTAKVLD